MIYDIETTAERMAVLNCVQTTEPSNGIVMDAGYNTIFDHRVNGVATPAVFCDLILV